MSLLVAEIELLVYEEFRGCLERNQGLPMMAFLLVSSREVFDQLYVRDNICQPRLHDNVGENFRDLVGVKSELSILLFSLPELVYFRCN